MRFAPLSFIFLMLIRAYRLCISPLLPVACRFTPSCSDYASDAIKTHGSIKGGLLAFARIARCHPWGKSGFDPVPPACVKGCNHE